jgi:O-antigen ligase
MKKFKIARIIFCLWLLVWPWQTKLIIRPAASAYSEISLFGSFLILLTPVIIWGGQLILSEYQKIRTAKRITLSWSLGLVILETIAVLSLIWATDKALAFYRLLFLTSGLVILNAVSQPYFIKKKNFIGFFVAGLILPACLAVGQFLWQQAPAVKYFGLASHTATVLGDSVVEVSGRRYLRAYGPFDHPNILGGVMVLGLMAAISGLFFLSYRLRDKVFYLVASGLFYTALFFSFSRTAWLALIVGVLLCLWVYGRRRLLRPNIFIILLLFFGLTFALFIPERSLVFSRTQTENRLENKSITERELYWQQADAVIKNDGAFGLF